uniref:protein-serine/threonine phosphatase n=1 Tax=Araucaria cunninghamii TaxID=56994 RepID=A0A0D6QYR5_ARACU
MLGGLMNLVSACWRPIERYVQTGADVVEEGHEGLLWYKDIGQHVAGEFSMAVAQANNLVEDQCQVESGPLGTFVGIYDGHGGPEAARFINDHLFHHFQKFALEERGISADVIRKAFIATEEAFLSVVTNAWPERPQLASVGSCCLVGVIHDRTLYVANLGDSRVVMGRLIRATGSVAAVQLSTEHNASMEAVRQELQSLHPDDSQIVVNKHGVWRVKGIIQVSRSIGDVYLKRPEFNREPLAAKFRLQEALLRPVLTAEPSISTHTLQPNDNFLIFASDGLWEHLNNQDAVDIVHNHPRIGSAKRLVKAALQEAAKKREMRYSDLKRIERGVRRHFHDDITVIVVFLDYDLVSRGHSRVSTVSVRGGGVS